ncbi:autoinducer binding domain-containing protein [Zooshikella sp. RANM57]|uniref:autoinducer binding domain-containing protein n=1 Tax=Zooshikella sp. RANM57 TaxID=3425863 RepID=UPI003D6E6D9F
MNKILEQAEKLKQIKSIEALTLHCNEIMDSLDIDYYIFRYYPPLQLTEDDMLSFGNYPEQWIDYYDINELVKIDPIHLHCKSHSTPIFWQEAKKIKQFNASEHRQVMTLAESAGLKDGITIPVHGLRRGVAFLSTAFHRTISIEKEIRNIANIQWITPFIYEAVNRIELSNSQNKTVLSKREKECLAWASSGKTSWEISQILGVSERTVNFHLTNATQKTNSSNRIQAIARSIIHGIIEPMY